MHRIRLSVTIGILMVFGAMLSAATLEDGLAQPRELIRIGFADTIFSDVNVNDAVASIEVWADCIAKSKGIPIKMEVEIFETAELLERAIVEERVDLIALLTHEFLEISRNVAMDNLYATVVRKRIEEEYLLLVRDELDCTDVSQLSGMTLKMLKNGRTSLALQWLDLFLDQRGQPASETHFNSIKFENKANLVILPVFFGKADSCLVTRNAFETMAELNPQVGRDLRVVAQSPPFVPALFCFRSGFQSEHKIEILEALDELHTQPSGSQVLIVFRGEQLVRINVKDLDNSRRLLESSPN